MKYLSIALLFVPLFIHAQTRTNRPIAKLSQPLITISKATGWRLDGDGRWVSRPNKIPNVAMNSKLIDYEENGLGNSNFVYLQLRKVYYAGDSSLLFIKKFKEGDYKYEAIQRGWFQDYNCTFGSVSFADWNTKHIDDSAGVIKVKVKLDFTGFLFGKSELEEIKKKYDTLQSPYSTDFLIVKYNVYPEKNLAHFIVFFMNNSISGNMYWDLKQEYNDYPLADYDAIEKAYYEMDYATFKKFFFDSK